MLQYERATALYEAQFFNEAWSSLIKPWVAEILKAPFNSKVSGVLVPNDALANYVKERLLKDDIPLLGLQIWTPASLRSYLLRSLNYPKTIALREDLHLLLQVAASREKSSLISSTIAKEPEGFMRFIDTVTAAGWNPASVLSNESLKTVLAHFYEMLDSMGLQTVQQAEAWLLKQVEHIKGLINNCLLFGFSSSHWHLFHFLQFIANISHAPTLSFFTDDTVDANTQAWIGAWEERFGSAQRIPERDSLNAQPFAFLAQEFLSNLSNPTLEIPNEKIPQFYAGETIAEEADLIITQVLQLLQKDECSRLGIIVPYETSPLAREIVTRLCHYGVSFDDNLGQALKQNGKQIILRTWAYWQRHGDAPAFLAFLKELLNFGNIDYALYKKAEKTLNRSIQTTLSLDFNVNKSYILSEPLHEELKNLFSDWSFFAQENTYEEYLKEAAIFLEKLSCSDEIPLLQKSANQFQADFKNNILDKEVFFNWFEKIIQPKGRLKSHLGKEVYAKVHLMTPDQACSQQWSHLILTGLSEGDWPSKDSSLMFLDDVVIESLNKRAIVQGRFGEGHLTIKEGKALLPSSFYKLHQAKLKFSKLLEITSEVLVLTTHLSKPDRLATATLPSDFFEQIYWLVYGTLLEPSELSRLNHFTKAYINKYKLLINPKEQSSLAQLTKAYQSRRNPEVPFGEFSFCFNKPPEQGLSISCKAWEDVTTRPEAAWFKHILGLRKESCFSQEALLPLAIGTWTHDFISYPNAEKTPAHKANHTFWREHVSRKVNALFEKVKNAYKSQQKEVPREWLEVCKNAQSLASDFIDKIIEHEDVEYLLSEYDLEGEVFSLHLKGRADLIALKTAELNHSQNACPWIIDFKTGSKGALTLRKLSKGDGLQLALYALALKSKGFTNVQISILQKSLSLSPQMDLENILSLENLWDEIARINKTGMLGQKTSAQNQYKFSSESPLATTAIPDDVLKEKWEKTYSFLPFE